MFRSRLKHCIRESVKMSAATTASDRLKEVLEGNKNLLIFNIIPSEEFRQLLIKENVITKTMLDDLQETEDRVDHNTKLFELIVMRRDISLKAFCRVLAQSGHQFLAEYLEDELADEEHGGGEHHTINEILRTNPKFKSLTGLQRHEIIAIVQEKIQKELVKKAWRTANARDKSRIMESHGELLTTTQRLKDEGSRRLKETDELHAQILQIHELKRTQEHETKTLQKAFKDLQTSTSNKIQAMASSNDACEKTIQCLEEKLALLTQFLANANLVLQDFFVGTNQQLLSETKQLNNATKSLLEVNVAALMEAIRRLNTSFDEYERLKEEIQSVLNTYSGTGTNEGDVDALQRVIAGLAEREMLLREGLARLQAKCNGQELSSWQAQAEESRMFTLIERKLDELMRENQRLKNHYINQTPDEEENKEKEDDSVGKGAKVKRPIRNGDRSPPTRTPARTPREIPKKKDIDKFTPPPITVSVKPSASVKTISFPNL